MASPHKKGPSKQNRETEFRATTHIDKGRAGSVVINKPCDAARLKIAGSSEGISTILLGKSANCFNFR
jgi:hypothetical protein